MQAFSGSVNYCLWALPLSNAFVDHPCSPVANSALILRLSLESYYMWEIGVLWVSVLFLIGTEGARL